MKALLIAAAVLVTTIPAEAQAPNLGADYVRLQQANLLEHMESSIRPRPNPIYPTIYTVMRPKRAPWYEDK